MAKSNKYLKALTGAHAVALAMKQINPEVVAMFPITPQTDIVEKFASYANDGAVDTEIIRAESEHSAMSAVVGAQAAGVRAMTATSSAGLALMWEIVGVASGLRLPIVMPVVNRALSAPINIHCDHSDSMGCRDLSWIQIYCENPQEAYDCVLLAMKVAEDQSVQLPAMICQDGFITSHCVETVKVLDDREVRKYIGKYKPTYPLLEVKRPVTVGPLDFYDYYFEHKRQQEEGMEKALRVYQKAAKELSKVTKRSYDIFEEYKLKDAEYVIVTMSSTAGTAKVAVDELRKEKIKAGLMKIRLFRPFPFDAVAKALKGKKAVAVLDRSMSFGSGAPLYSEIRNALYDVDKKPPVVSFVFGLGGRDIKVEHIKDVYNSLKKVKGDQPTNYINLRGEKQR